VNIERSIEIEGFVCVPREITADMFMDMFIKFIEDNGMTFGGGIQDCGFHLENRERN
jgi:O-acetylhomoserine/O-acetylserine sulfhydrylase-like pyridoxal-dependent enzyme